MPDGLDIQAIANDPEFHALPLDERSKVMSSADPDFARLPRSEQYKAVSKLQQNYDEAHANGTSLVADQTPQGSLIARFSSGMWSGVKAMVPSTPDMTSVALSGLGPLPGMARAAYQGYRQAITERQPIPSAIASGLGSTIGLDPEDIRARANRGDVAGIIGEGVPSIAAALIGGDLPRLEETKDAIGRTLRNPGNLGDVKKVSTLKPGVNAAASTFKLLGGPEIVNAIVPDHPNPVGPTSPLTGRLPTPNDPVADAVRSHSASWIPTRIEAPEPSPFTGMTSSNDRGLPPATDPVSNYRPGITGDRNFPGNGGYYSAITSGRPAEIVPMNRGKQTEGIRGSVANPSGRLVLSPEEALAEQQMLDIAKRRASQNGLQYAAGMRPAGGGRVPMTPTGTTTVPYPGPREVISVDALDNPFDRQPDVSVNGKAPRLPIRKISGSK
jgi:hypothetical protein